MNICLITPAFPLDEEDYRAAFCLDFARILIEKKHRVFIHTPERDGRKTDLGLDIRWFPWSGGRKAIARTRFWHPRDLFDLANLIRSGTRSLLELVGEEKIDACLAFWAIPSGVFAYRVFRKTQVPYAVWALGSDIWTFGRIPFFRQTIRKVFRNASNAFADGFDLAKNVEKIAGVDCTFLPSSRRLPPAGEGVRKEAGIRTRFLFVGRFDKVKGIEHLIEAALKLRRKRKDFSVRIFGEGPLGDRLRGRIETAGLADTVTLGGPLSRQAFSNELQRTNALVIPSLMESIPVVMTDALQKGVPVLASNVGDMGYLIRVYAAGLVFEPGDPEGLAGCMAQFIDGRADCTGRIHELVKEINIEKAAAVYLKSLKGKPDGADA
jgi:glycosyltransferase involved in cell wall biosynthesis